MSEAVPAKPRSSRRLWLVFVVVAGLGLAACGNGDDNAGTGEDVTTTTASDNGAAAGDNTIVMDNIQFMPSQLEVSVGTSVTARNEDNLAHTWTADDDRWDSGNLSPGERFDFEFTEAGSFDFHCQIHPSMTGTVTVSG